MIEVYEPPAPPPPPSPRGPRPAAAARWCASICLSRARLPLLCPSICNDRLGKKIRVKCNPDDTVGDLKKLLAAQTGTRRVGKKGLERAP